VDEQRELVNSIRLQCDGAYHKYSAAWEVNLTMFLFASQDLTWGWSRGGRQLVAVPAVGHSGIGLHVRAMNSDRRRCWRKRKKVQENFQVLRISDDH